MKKIGSYTLRGKINSQAGAGVPEMIRLFDGRFDTGYVITKFRIGPNDVTSTLFESLRGKLMTTSAGNPLFWNWADNEEIGWATTTFDGNGIAPSEFNLIDRDHIVIEDLFVYFNSTSGVTGNYYIEMDKYDITDARGALAMVRNNSQSV